MTNKAVSELTSAAALDGTELFYADDGSADVKVTANQIKDFAASTVVVPSVDNTVPRFDGVVGDMQLSGVTIDDDDAIGCAAINVTDLSVGSGVAADNSLNLISLGNDALDGAAQTFVNGLSIIHSFGGATLKGGRQALSALLNFNGGATSASNANRNYCTTASSVIARSHDGGTDPVTDPSGAFFAFNATASAVSGATALTELAGMEVNVQAETGSSVHYKTGVSIAAGQTDAVAGTDVDAMISLSNQAGALGWTDAILLSRANGAKPLAATGSVIRSVSADTITNGIDLHTYTITGYLLRGSNFLLAGDGTAMTMNGTGASIELGSASGANSPHIDFHSSGNVVDYDSRIIGTGGSGVAGTGDIFIGAATFNPLVSDGTALGTTSLQWSDLFLAEGAVINWDSGDMTVTQTGNDLRVEGGGMVIGHTARIAADNAFGNAATNAFQLVGTITNASQSILSFGANTGGASMILGHSRNASLGSHTVVVADDQVGFIGFDGSDGTNFEPCASIVAEIDGTPGDNDMPGRLTFRTTKDGAAVPTEAFRVNSLQKAIIQNGVSIPAGTSTASQALQMFSGGPWISAGTGDPSHTSTKGSLYIKTDATTTTTRLWINTDGSTTWTFFTSAA